MSANYPIASQGQTKTQEIMVSNFTKLEVYRNPLELTLLKDGRGIKGPDGTPWIIFQNYFAFCLYNFPELNSEIHKSDKVF